MRIFPIIIFLAMPLAALAENPPSLFFGANEKPEMALENMQQDTAAPNRQPYNLQAIVWFAPDRWQVWIDGRRFTPDMQDASMSITRVTAQSVTLSVNGKPLTLYPGQSAGH